jgi:hypothetical protein
MLKKIRIQLFDNNGTPISDRLVEQSTEFYQGPKEKHDGPLRIEFSFTNTTDVAGAIEYLKKLNGTLPIEQKSTRGRKAEKPEFVESNNREVLLEESLAKSKNQDQFIEFLRKEHDFVFVESDRLKQLIPEGYEIKPRHFDKYQWFVRCTKKAKDPRNDKFDIALLIGIVILPDSEREDKMVIYMNGKFEGIKKLPLPKKDPLTFKQTNLIKYPHYMEYDEREKWGVEHRLLQQDENRKPSKFYNRWAKDIEVGDYNN